MSSFDWSVAAQVAVFVFTPVLSWALWSMRQSFVKKEEFSAAVEQRAEQNRKTDLRISALESRLAVQPDQKGLHELAMTVEKLNGEIKAMGAHMEGLKNELSKLDAITQRQEDYLLNKGK